MSTFVKKMKTCPICGNTFESEELASTNEFGALDLDLRPAPMRRHTMNTWIEHCPRCRFSAYSMDDNDGASLDSIKEFYKDNEYLLELVSGEKKDTLAEFFLQVHFRRMEEGIYDDAAMSAIRAAWDCDDRQNEDGAFVCRNLAIDAIESLSSLDETLLVIKADLLRRAGRFDEVLENYANFHSAENAFLNSIVAFQIKKSKDSDSGRHTLNEIEES